MLSSIKAEIKKNKKGGEGRRSFRLLGHTAPTLVLQMRHHIRNKALPNQGWGQVTCKLATEREVVMLDGSGKELPQLEGEGQSIFNNVTIGVFEVYFGDSSKRWRLAMLEEVGGLQPEGAASHTP
ncbi:unnamed protein product [Discosporangium mesarthrocarpum]